MVVCKGKYHLEMDDDWGYPHFRKPPYHKLWRDSSLFVSLDATPCGKIKLTEQPALGGRTFQELINEFSLCDRSVDVQFEDLSNSQAQRNSLKKHALSLN